MTDFNPTGCFYDLLGWQGGTIHQVGHELGIRGSDLLTTKPKDTATDSDYMKGQYAYSTCSHKWVHERLIPKYRGNLDFWLGYKTAYLIDKG